MSVAPKMQNEVMASLSPGVIIPWKFVFPDTAVRIEVVSYLDFAGVRLGRKEITISRRKMQMKN